MEIVITMTALLVWYRKTFFPSSISVLDASMTTGWKARTKTNAKKTTNSITGPIAFAGGPFGVAAVGLRKDPERRSVGFAGSTNPCCCSSARAFPGGAIAAQLFADWEKPATVGRAANL